MSIRGSVWKPNLLMASSSCRAQTVCRTFSRRCKKSLSNDSLLLSILKKRTRNFFKKQDLGVHIARTRKVMIACKKMITAVNKFKQQLAKHRKNLIMCVAMAFTFDWYKERICVDELIRLRQEFGIVKKLNKQSTSNNIIQNEQNINISQKPVSNINELNCSMSKTENNKNQIECSYNSCDCPRCRNMSEEGWEPFTSGSYYNAWRKPNVDYPGQNLYIYKVHGLFNDITALDFMQVQLDLQYRKEWDNMSVDLDIFDSEPLTHSDLIYWEFRWPKWFQNRDYVFKRRYKIDEDEKLMLIVCESIEHPDYPEQNNKWRVKDYWSYIVIKPHKDFDKPGVEFSITYFDDPGVTVSNYLTSWYQCKGLPSFLNDQRLAALELTKRRFEENNILKPEKTNIEAKLDQPQTQTSWISWIFGYFLF
ncbi:stAR-related lipid transfer protein 7, mitochondrial [Metopolophium dirhodum]|uniref:stAR-related lipid transfer protein 7, mitochondrial n=1 Tax=Metopolophium dirhodum TaxID=44670 RepID=UPI0029906964|nr:stAR-related lipid transfer protein 7, mitochondrial [Metopolophium dirhodum]XP_060869224.1 stAR-related lipid transfer protein 7, mitochondrial [Metopolophium dirhodum]